VPSWRGGNKCIQGWAGLGAEHTHTAATAVLPPRAVGAEVGSQEHSLLFPLFVMVKKSILPHAP
jgi:hypothetical protein